MRWAYRYPWLFLAIAVTIWLAIGVLTMAIILPDAEGRGPALIWVSLFGIYSAALLASLAVGRRWRTGQILLAAIETISVIAMATVPGRGDPGPLLAPVALQVALLFETRAALSWVLVQSLLIWFARWKHLPEMLSWLYWALNVAAEVIAVGAVHIRRRETETSQSLGRINAELRAAQALLADSAATAERMRISRELHDAWGHDLTALSLQLEYASHVAPETGRASVIEARDLAKSLLAKVRDVVGTLRRYEGHDVKPALEALAAGAPELIVHLDLPDLLVLQPPETAQALVRSAQEIITNTRRHARAHNLWLALQADASGVRLDSRDDGEGAERFTLGYGLSGIRERFEQLGGRIDFESARGSGFRVAGWIPAQPSKP